MEWFVLFLGVVMALLAALVEAIRFSPTGENQELLPLYFGLQRLVVTMLVAGLFGVLLAGFEPWLALLIGFGLLLLVGIATGLGWLSGLGRALQKELEPYIWKLVKAGAPVFKLFAPKTADTSDQASKSVEEEPPAPMSKEELKHVIEQDGAVLAPDEKSRLLSAMHFGNKNIADVMVPASKIATVDESEPMGPLLLDKLHKTGHQIIVGVKKDLAHVSGLLNMADLVPLDPDIKEVADALRPKIHYVPATAPLSAVLVASITIGRQLFLVVDKQGKIVGLITLADALEHALGSRLAKEAMVSTDPKKLS